MTTPQEPRIYCKYCGAKLKKGPVGKYCPTKNCQWQHGMPKEEEWTKTPTFRCA